MLKNISVSTKGFAAFAILAFIAIGASSLIHMRALTANELARNSQTMASLLAETAGLNADASQANLQVKNFLLTGNRWRELGGVRRVGKRAAEVRGGKSKRHNLLATAEPKTEVLALREEAGWVRIGIPGSGVMGWVQGKRLERSR